MLRPTKKELAQAEADKLETPEVKEAVNVRPDDVVEAFVKDTDKDSDELDVMGLQADRIRKYLLEMKRRELQLPRDEVDSTGLFVTNNDALGFKEWQTAERIRVVKKTMETVKRSRAMRKKTKNTAESMEDILSALKGRKALIESELEDAQEDFHDDVDYDDDVSDDYWRDS